MRVGDALHGVVRAVLEPLLAELVRRDGDPARETSWPAAPLLRRVAPQRICGHGRLVELCRVCGGDE